MSLIVQKFGGTSLADLQKISQVVDRITATYRAGHQLVVVVSAMAGDTDNLAALAHRITAAPNLREFDVLLASGEQVSIALLAIALTERGYLAKSYTGNQVSIITDKVHGKARIVGIDTEKIQQDVLAGYIVIVAGFQGINEAGDITTLGRGGSDTTAVAIAGAMRADECQIYTDVDGVFTADPKILSTAVCLEKISFAEMAELSAAGAKVLQKRAIELAGHFKMPLRILPTFNYGAGTLIEYNNNALSRVISSIASDSKQCLVMVNDISDYQMINKILEQLAMVNIEVDLLAQAVMPANSINLSFMVAQDEVLMVKSITESVIGEMAVKSVFIDPHVARISVVGFGIGACTEVINKIYYSLHSNNIRIKLISTGEIKVSIVVDEKVLEIGVKILHQALGLGTMSQAVKVSKPHTEYEMQVN